MATGSDPYGQVEDPAARAARLAAMQRAAGYTNPADAETGASAPMSVSPEQSSALFRAASAANDPTGGSAPMSISPEQTAAMQKSIADTAARNAQYKNPMDAETGGSAPMGTSPEQQRALAGASTSPSDPNALARAAAGGSLSTVQPPVATPVIGLEQGAFGNRNPDTSTLLGRMVGGVDQGPKTPDTSTISDTSGAGNTLIDMPHPGIDQGAFGDRNPDLGGLTSNIVSQLQSIGQSAIGPNASPDVTGVFLQQSQAILKMLDDQEAQLRAENEKSGAQIDPATQFTIDKMREGLNEQLKTVREDLNRRGLNDSGILLELENRLQKGSLSDQGRVLAERLTSLQDQLTKGLAGIRGQKYSTMQSFGSQAAESQFQAGENQKKNALDRAQSQLQGMLSLRGQQSNENQASLDRSFKSNESALQRAYGDAQAKAQTAAQFEQNRQQFEQQMALQNAKGGTASGGTALARAAGAAKPAATGDVTSQAVAELKGAFTNSAEANAAIKENMRELAGAGVDIAALVDAANGLGGRRVGTVNY